MNEQEILLGMNNDLGTPIQVSAADGAIRRMAERVEQVRLDVVATENSPGSCGGVPGGWGN
jgi:hypothetical protein